MVKNPSETPQSNSRIDVVNALSRKLVLSWEATNQGITARAAPWWLDLSVEATLGQS